MSSTIDAKHNKIMINFNHEKKNKSNLIDNYNDYQEKLNNFKLKNKNLITDDEFNEYINLKETVSEYESNIKNIENQNDIVDYYLKNLNVLGEYYTLKKNIASNKESSNEFLNSDKSLFKKTKSLNNSKLLHDFLLNNENNYFKKKFTTNENMCNKCSQEMIFHSQECILECPSCGLTNYVIVDSSKPSYKEPPPEVSYFAYKRINHFNEWLCQFQGKETTDIPESVYNSILAEIKKERITNMSLITSQKIRQYLKKLKLNKYYEHTTHIINRLNGVSLPLINKEVEDKLRRMFKDIQEPFIKVCPKTRKNFLSYSYVLHKFVELLKMDDLKQYFPLLKSREKLHQQDLIWKNICEILDWPFYKSI